MKLYTEKAACCGCGACKDACPAGAVGMVSDREGFLYPQIDEDKCLKCNRCKQVCPVRRAEAHDLPERRQNLYFGAQAKAEAIRRESSSGGVFPLLAEYVFQQQGIVYGAAYDREMRVVHRAAHNMEELGGLKRTKYVQSNLDGTYQEIENQLKAGKRVLFCGTPCQVHALSLFLGSFYPRLILVDLVCYGAPSPGIWASYVKYLERRSGGKMTDFSFRDKRNRDNGHTCAYVTGDREQAGSLYEDLYCKMYFANYTIRPSCHECRYCTVDRDSDFTIGDFWGIGKVRPEMEDGMGTSVVILHRSAAQEIWEQVKGELRWFACSRENALQPRLKSPTPVAKGRKWFMALYRMLPFPVFLFLFSRVALVGKLMERAVKS